MPLKCYVVYDKLTNSIHSIGMDVTPGRFVCSYGPVLYRSNRNFEKELLLFEVGEFSQSPLGFKSYGSFKELSWDCYKEPESEASVEVVK